jgi:hypothetical protein
MWISPQTPNQKFGVIMCGLFAGVSAAVGTAAGFLVLGIAISLFADSTGSIHLGEYQSWLPVIGLEYGFVPGIIIGAFVCWKVCRTRLER